VPNIRGLCLRSAAEFVVELSSFYHDIYIFMPRDVYISNVENCPIHQRSHCHLISTSIFDYFSLINQFQMAQFDPIPNLPINRRVVIHRTMATRSSSRVPKTNWLLRTTRDPRMPRATSSARSSTPLLKRSRAAERRIYIATRV
jgi:hypothetical protein